jgi:hypothetical protein
MYYVNGPMILWTIFSRRGPTAAAKQYRRLGYLGDAVWLAAVAGLVIYFCL